MVDAACREAGASSSLVHVGAGLSSSSPRSCNVVALRLRFAECVVVVTVPLLFPAPSAAGGDAPTGVASGAGGSYALLIVNSAFSCV